MGIVESGLEIWVKMDDSNELILQAIKDNKLIYPSDLTETDLNQKFPLDCTTTP